jgi:hypothetical protein
MPLMHDLYSVLHILQPAHQPAVPRAVTYEVTATFKSLLTSTPSPSFSYASICPLPSTHHLTANMSDRQTGTVKSFNEEKGQGFISPSSGGMELTVHFTDIEVCRCPCANFVRTQVTRLIQGYDRPLAFAALRKDRA